MSAPLAQKPWVPKRKPWVPQSQNPSTDFLEKFPPLLPDRPLQGGGGFSNRSQNNWFSGSGRLRPPDLPRTRGDSSRGNLSRKSVDSSSDLQMRSQSCGARRMRLLGRTSAGARRTQPRYKITEHHIWPDLVELAADKICINFRYVSKWGIIFADTV